MKLDIAAAGIILGLAIGYLAAFGNLPADAPQCGPLMLLAMLTVPVCGIYCFGRLAIK